MYPDENLVTVLLEKARTTVDDCRGTIVTPSKPEPFEVFIPDRGCKLMWLRFRHNRQAWRWLAEMHDVG
jgi:hypothetical protein